MIFPEAYDPYGNLIAHEINDDFSKDDKEIEIVTPEAHAEEKEPSKDSVSYHLDRRVGILKTQAEEKLKKESLSNLIGFGLVGIVGVLILKRYFK